MQTTTGAEFVFVVGSPRSGTTWVQRLLAAHPQVVTGQESDLFDMYVGPQLQTWRRELDANRNVRGGLGLGCYMEEAEFEDALRTYLMKLMQPMLQQVSPGQLFVEKTPSHALFVEEIDRLLPDARFVHVIRDPRDVVASLLAASRSWGVDWAPRNSLDAARMWAIHVEAAADGLSKVPRARWRQLRYEDLHAHPEEELEELLRFLDLEVNPDLLATAIAENARGRPGTPIRIGGAFGGSEETSVDEPAGFVRSGQPGGWSKDLGPLSRRVVQARTRALARRFGYDI